MTSMQTELTYITYIKYIKTYTLRHVYIQVCIYTYIMHTNTYIYTHTNHQLQTGSGRIETLAKQISKAPPASMSSAEPSQPRLTNIVPSHTHVIVRNVSSASSAKLSSGPTKPLPAILTMRDSPPAKLISSEPLPNTYGTSGGANKAGDATGGAKKAGNVAAVYADSQVSADLMIANPVGARLYVDKPTLRGT